MGTPLFLDAKLHPVFQKIAAPVKLSDNPDKWQTEVSTQVYGQVPFLADYAVNVVFDKVDGQRGTAMGRVQVTPKSEAATVEEQKELPKALIPLIVTNRMLQPLDVFMDGEGVYPLSDWRLREKLARTSPFETSSRKPVDQGIVDQLYPPLRTNYGYGNSIATGTGIGGFGKFAESAKRASLLSAIAPTIPPVEADEFVDQISKDDELKLLVARDPELQKLAMVIATGAGPGVEKTASALVDSIRPTALQLTKLANGNFRVRYANRSAFLIKEAQVPPEQAASIAGNDMVTDMKPDSTITVSTEKAKKTDLKSEKIETIRDFGQYRCQVTPSNEPVVGWVLPVIDLEMHPLPLFLFTDGQQYSLQDDIAGSRVGHNLQLPQSPPQGDGCFYFVDNERATALLPMTIQHTITNPDGSMAYAVEDAFGQSVELHLSPGMNAIEPMEEGKYAVPDSLMWMPLGEAVHLVKSPEQVTNIQQGQEMGGAVDVTPTGQDEVSLGGAPLAKVAAADRQFIDHNKAEFLLVAMGANPFEVREKLAHAQRYGSAQLTGLKPILPLADMHSQMVKEAAKLLTDFPYHLRRNLIKEAATLSDSESADKILALNFLNPENIAMFASYLPALDETAGKLAEMLIAARLGQRQIPEAAVERCMKNLDQVIVGLQALNQKGALA